MVSVVFRVLILGVKKTD